MNRRRYWIGIVLFVWPLWLTLSSFHAADFLQELQDKYTAYTTKYTGVKLQVLFNQPYFAPGDTAFFQAWYLNDASQPIKGEHSVTLELLNAAGKSVQRMRFKVKDGSGYNQLVIPNDLPGGAYKAVGYTDWMRNFGAAWFYQKRMTIVSQKDIQVNGIEPTQVAFFPEGGKLVAGLSNKVVVTGPQNLLVSIRDEAGTEVTTASLDSSGLGAIDITPAPGRQYVGVSAQQTKQWMLPKVDLSGIVVRLTNEMRGEFEFAIQENSEWSDKELYALILSQGAIVLRQAFVAKASEPFHLTLPENVHVGEVHQLYIFSGAGKVLAERVFRPGGKPPLTMRPMGLMFFLILNRVTKTG